MSKLLCLIFLFSCAGYKYRNKQNPFAQFGIRSISVPMFYNHSNYPNVQSKFTREILNTMIDYKNLEVKPGFQTADAVVIGIVTSRDKKRESTRTTILNSVEDSFGESAFENSREDMFIPRQRTINLQLRVLVLKQPSQEEILFLTSKMGETAISSKIIFNEVINLSSTQTLKTLNDDAMKVLGTQNRGLTRQTITNMAKSAASSFKDKILYAF